MVQLNGKGVKKHFGVGVTLHVVAGFVEFIDNGLLLGNATEFVKAAGKISFSTSGKLLGLISVNHPQPNGLL